MKNFYTTVSLAVSFTLLSFIKTDLYGQDLYRNDLVWGFTGGYNSSDISGLHETILSEPFFTGYTMKSGKRSGALGGLFLNYRKIAANHFSAQLEFIYSQQGGDLLFDNTQTHFNYKMEFKYQYLNINVLAKGYLFNYENEERNDNLLSRFNISGGFCFGINMTPSNLKYSSGGTGNSPLFGTELEQQQQLRNVLKGKANVAFCVGAGYEFGHLIVDFRYSKSLRDVLETEANSYNFLENTNLTECKQVTLTWYFPLNLK